MNELSGTRFGTIQVDEASTIHLPAGLIGFPSETRFVLIRGEHARLAYLQSLTTPHLALAVVDAAVFGAGYPEPDAAALAHEAGLALDAELAVLVPVALRDGEGRLVANQLAPIVVDSVARRAAQVVLDPRRYSTTAPVPPDAG